MRSPEPEDAENLLQSMRIVMRESPHLLLEPDEFNYTVEQEAEILRTFRDHEDKLWNRSACRSMRATRERSIFI